MFAIASTVDRLKEEHHRMVGESMRALDRPLVIDADEVEELTSRLLPPNATTEAHRAFLAELRAGRIRYMGHPVLVRHGELTIAERQQLAGEFTGALKALAG